MRHVDTIYGAKARDGHPADDPIEFRRAERFEDGNQRHVQLAFPELGRKCRGVGKKQPAPARGTPAAAIQTMNERATVEILHTTDAQPLEACKKRHAVEAGVVVRAAQGGVELNFP